MWYLLKPFVMARSLPGSRTLLGKRKSLPNIRLSVQATKAYVGTADGVISHDSFSALLSFLKPSWSNPRTSWQQTQAWGSHICKDAVYVRTRCGTQRIMPAMSLLHGFLSVAQASHLVFDACRHFICMSRSPLHCIDKIHTGQR